MTDMWLNVQQIAEYLGLAPNTVRLWCNTRGLPHVRVGAKREIRGKRMAIDNWMMKGMTNHDRKHFQRLCQQGEVQAGG